MELINSIRNQISQSNNIAIIIPTPADTDAVVCGYLLNSWLKELGKKSTAISATLLSDFLTQVLNDDRFLVSNQLLEADLYIIIDCPSLRHTGFVEEISKINSEKIILIDHHDISDLSKKAGIIYRDSNWSSTAEGLYYLLASQQKIIARQATLLLLAIIADTGRFQFNFSEKTLVLVSKLLSLGANLRYASARYNLTKHSILELKLWGEILKNLKFIEKWNLVVAKVDQKMLARFDLDEKTTEGMAGFLTSQNIADLIIVLIEQPDGRVRGLVRSNDKRRPAGQIAKLFGGSGFDRAGGFIIKKTFATLN